MSDAVRLGYKQTQIGEIPEDWDISELGNGHLATVVMGQSPPSSTYNENGVGLPFLQGKTEFGDMYPKPRFYCAKPAKIAKKDDVLISVRAPVGDVNLSPFTCCIGRGLAAIRANPEGLDHRFAFYYLLQSGKRISSLSAGSTFQAVRKHDLTTFPIAVPSIVEQRNIAEILSTVDEAIQNADRIISKTQELKRGLMQSLLTRGIGHTRFKETEMGEIPEEWEVINLGSIFDLSSGKVRPKDLSKSQTTVNAHPVYGGNGVLGYSDQLLVDSETVVIGRVGQYCGSVLRTWGPAWITDNALYVEKSLREMDTSFLTWYLQSMRLNRYSKRSGQPLITQSAIYLLRAAVPNLQEQTEIASILGTVEQRIAVEVGRRDELRNLKKGLMQRLLTGKVRVKV